MKVFFLQKKLVFCILIFPQIYFQPLIKAPFKTTNNTLIYSSDFPAKENSYPALLNSDKIFSMMFCAPSRVKDEIPALLICSIFKSLILSIKLWFQLS